MKKSMLIILVFALILLFSPSLFAAGDLLGSNVIKQGLVGAGTGAIAAGATGGKAGKGALIGAGTGAVGGILLDALTGSNKQSSATVAPPPGEEGDYYEYEEPEAPTNNTGKIIGEGLVGAGTGAIAAGASGGKAGQGALIGAGTGVIGSVLLDAITGSNKQPAKKVYIKKPQPTQEQAKTPTKRVIKKYDEKGNLVSEEEIYQ